MLCDECGKNQASIHIVQITPEGKAARNLCQQCAAKFGAGLPSLEEMGDLEGDFTVNDFLRGVFGGSQSHRDEKKNRPLTGKNLSDRDIGILDPAKVFNSGKDEEKQGSSDSQQEESVDSMRCDSCGLTLQEFADSGKLGCDSCYMSFQKYLTPVLKRIHGAGSHSGKIPARSGDKLAVKRHLETLRTKLKEAVAAEEYEKAAEYRDMIRAMEQEKGEV
ncbi:MAG: UvrB/UvrC motif-containing protein [Selenomonadaceae bacterium]|nr:UvrB/UvrC motif-containing protein [Selenomonadaceae bacterium]